jgi:hypothetical protein
MCGARFELLGYLHRRLGTVCTRDDIISTLYPDEPLGASGGENRVDSLMRHLRKAVAHERPRYLPGRASHGTIQFGRATISATGSVWDGQREKMRDLRALREGWEDVAAEETRLLRDLTIEESARQLLRLQEAFEPQLQATAHLFAPQRWGALAELQARLQRLAEWQGQHEQPIHLDPGPATASD